MIIMKNFQNNFCAMKFGIITNDIFEASWSSNIFSLIQKFQTSKSNKMQCAKKGDSTVRSSLLLNDFEIP